MRIVAYVPDLMDRSKVSATAIAVGADVTMVSTPAALVDAATGAALVVVDLGRPGVLEIIPQLAGGRTVGFASHVDTALLRAARHAGCGTVLARSAFFGRLPEILSGGGGDTTG